MSLPLRTNTRVLTSAIYSRLTLEPVVNPLSWTGRTEATGRRRAVVMLLSEPRIASDGFSANTSPAPPDESLANELDRIYSQAKHELGGR